MNQTLDKKAFGKYLAALLLFGSNGVVASRISLSSYDIVYLRTMIGSALLLAVFLLTGGRFRLKANRRDGVFIALSGVAMGAGWMFLYEAYQQIGVSIASLLYYCGPVIVMALSPVLFRERLTAPKVAGFLIVLAGVVLVSGGAVSGGLNPWGFLCGGLSAVMYALMVTLNKQAKTVTGLENAALQLAAAFLTVAVFVGIRQRFAFTVQAAEWPWILFLGLVNTGLGCYLYFAPLSKLPVQTVALCGYLEPLSAVVLSALLLREAMTPVQLAGAACIIGGAMLGELAKPKTKRPD